MFAFEEILSPRGKQENKPQTFFPLKRLQSKHDRRVSESDQQQASKTGKIQAGEAPNKENNQTKTNSRSNPKSNTTVFSIPTAPNTPMQPLWKVKGRRVFFSTKRNKANQNKHTKPQKHKNQTAAQKKTLFNKKYSVFNPDRCSENGVCSYLSF